MFMYGYSWWMGPMMLLGILGFWALVVFTIKYLITDSNRPPVPRAASDARTVLDGRLASGDIDVDEYTRLRTALDQPTTARSKTR